MKTLTADKAFEHAMYDLYRVWKRDLRYNATRYLAMLTDHGAVETASRLVRSPISDGFTMLSGKGRLDLTVEALVLSPGFEKLFEADVYQEARRKLMDAGHLDDDAHA